MELPQSNFVTITKMFHFEMAHTLYNHAGPCRNIHGHSYRLHVTLSGPIKNEPGAPDDGMIMDFKQLKSLVKEKILDKYDHAFAINESAPYASDMAKLDFEKILLLPFQPTCENLIAHFASLLVPALPEGVKLQRLRLFETETSYADWQV